jgi:hypothetical protein
MTKYRILKNDDHYVVQKRWMFLWFYIKFSRVDGSTQMCFFSSSIYNERENRHGNRGGIFETQKEAESTILNERNYTYERERVESRYKKVHTYIDSKLDKVLKGE